MIDILFHIAKARASKIRRLDILYKDEMIMIHALFHRHGYPRQEGFIHFLNFILFCTIFIDFCMLLDVDGART